MAGLKCALFGFLVLLLGACAFSPEVPVGGSFDSGLPGVDGGDLGGSGKDLQGDLAGDGANLKDGPGTDGPSDALGDGGRDANPGADSRDAAGPDTLEDASPADTLADLADSAPDTEICQPNCDFPACGGDDGCGGTCGCPTNYDCITLPAQGCTPDCDALCAGQECGTAGLAGECDCAALNGGCDDKNPCTLDVCDAFGQCSNPANNAGVCEDPDPCTLGDYCSGGVCKGGSTQRTCNDGDSCTEDSCVEGEGCLNTPKVCDDGDKCNGISTCVNGSCSQTIPAVICKAKDACHGVGTCDPLSGICSNPVANEGGLCNDDNNKCNGISTCKNGTCTQTTDIVVCSPLDQCHLAGTCAAATGLCSNPVGNEGVLCNDDGNKCNGISTCKTGVCNVTTKPVVCTAADACHVAGTCTPATGVCTNPAGNNGAKCGEGARTCANGVCLSAGFLAVPAGNFWMGSPGGCPAPVGYPGACTAELGRNANEVLHKVTLTNAFELQTTEVTQAQWAALLDGWNPSALATCGATCPVEALTWFDAVAFANWKSGAAGLTPCYAITDAACTDGTVVGSSYGECLNKTRGGLASATVKLKDSTGTVYTCSGYRLPTEAEWEYAARAGSNTAFYPATGSDGKITQTGKTPLDPNLDKIGWYGGNSSVTYTGGGDCKGWFPGALRCGTQAVAGKLANAWGFRDLSGNVFEWAWDLTELYPAGPVQDPTGGSTGKARSLRGGGWGWGANEARSAFRGVFNPDVKGWDIGLRLARTIKPCTTDCCVPSCAGKQCGDDGCGGVCGECPGSAYCKSNLCVDKGFVLAPAGSFWMGSPEGCPAPAGYPGACAAEKGRLINETLHQVTLTRPFGIQVLEVTQGQWVGAFGWNPSYFSACGLDCPVENLSWFDALAYANKMSVSAGRQECYVFFNVKCEDGSSQGTDSWKCLNSVRKGIDSATVTLAGGVANSYQCSGFRLPTEAEWEYAARAGSTTAFYPSDGNDGRITHTGLTPLDANLDKIGWYGGNAKATYAGGVDVGGVLIGTQPVGQKAANAWGLKDASGNVAEWLFDWFSVLAADAATDPIGGTTGTGRVIRGGGVANDASGCRSAMRHIGTLGDRAGSVGFRLVRTLAP
jgi:formylglycine-generating enzyme required for sulfatase activity